MDVRQSHPIPPDPMVVAGILIGGHSRRMGAAKTELTHQGQRFIDRAIQRAGAVAPEVVLLGRPQSRPAGLEHLVCLSDPLPEAGPLAGLYSLLRHAGDRWALLLACDMPLVDADLLRRILEEPRESADAVAFRQVSTPRQVPCCMLVHPRVRPHVEAALRCEERSLRSLLDDIQCVWIETGEECQRMLYNVNTPEDYTRLTTHARATESSEQA